MEKFDDIMNKVFMQIIMANMKKRKLLK